MTVEELLKPRYKVKTVNGKHYPFSPFFEGEIIELSPSVPKTWFIITKGSGEDQITFSESTLNDYPHLFQPLEWYEDRKPEDMPEYVKWGENGKPLKFAQTIVAYSPDSGKIVYMASGWLPSTHEEYLNWKPVNTRIGAEKPLTQCMVGRDTECNHPQCPVTDEDAANGKYCTLPLYDYRQ